jgi:hypothetical protein
VSGRSLSGRSRSDRGTVTVEAAIALGAVVLVLAAALSAVAAVLGQLHCTDAAREAARLVARGESGRAREAVDRIAPRGARLTVLVSGDTAQVEVAADPPGGFLPGIHLRADAYAVLEPTAADPALPPAAGPLGTGS